MRFFFVDCKRGPANLTQAPVKAPLMTLWRFVLRMREEISFFGYFDVMLGNVPPVTLEKGEEGLQKGPSVHTTTLPTQLLMPSRFPADTASELRFEAGLDPPKPRHRNTGCQIPPSHHGPGTSSAARNGRPYTNVFAKLTSN